MTNHEAVISSDSAVSARERILAMLNENRDGGKSWIWVMTTPSGETIQVKGKIVNRLDAERKRVEALKKAGVLADYAIVPLEVDHTELHAVFVQRGEDFDAKKHLIPTIEEEVIKKY